MPFNTNSKPGSAQVPVAIGDTITNLTAGSILFGGAAGILAQDNSNLFFDNTNNRLGVGINSSILARLHVKGSGATSATSSAIFTNNSGNSVFQLKDDLKANFFGDVDFSKTDGSNTVFKFTDAGRYLIFENFAGQQMAIWNMSNNGGCAMNSAAATNQGAFAWNGKNGNSVASGINSTAFGKYSEAVGENSVCYGNYGKAYFDNQTTIGNGLNTQCGDHKVVLGKTLNNVAQNTLIPIKDLDFNNYSGSYMAILVKVRTTVVTGLAEVQTIDEVFTCDISAGTMAMVGSKVVNYNGGDAAMSTGSMTYSFSGKVISIGYTTPTLHADTSYIINTIFEFGMIGE